MTADASNALSRTLAEVLRCVVFLFKARKILSFFFRLFSLMQFQACGKVWESIKNSHIPLTWTVPMLTFSDTCLILLSTCLCFHSHLRVSGHADMIHDDPKDINVCVLETRTLSFSTAVLSTAPQDRMFAWI